MTAADVLRKEGYDRGHKTGCEEGSRRMLLLFLANRFGPLPDEVEKRIHAASSGQLDAWAQATLSAPTLDEVFAGTP
jgi:hypothetical protein